MSEPAALPKRRAPSLAQGLVDALALRIRQGQLAPAAKLPTEGQLMAEHGVSRTVVREALSSLKASGLVFTRHGVGTFVADESQRTSAFRIEPQQMETLRDVIGVLELRIGIETEAAALAAQRRSPENLSVMRQALDDFARTVEQGRDAVTADYRFHGEIARATHNEHFEGLLVTLGPRSIPRARLDQSQALNAERLAYLKRVNAEHESIFDAIAAGDADAARAAMRMHLVNSRERRRRAAAMAGTAG